MEQKKIVILTLAGVVVLSLSIFGAYTITKFVNTPNDNTNQTAGTSPTPAIKKVDAESYCPLNGKRYTTEDQLRWEQKHPVAVMIENHPQSRPQSGLTSADVVYEAVAEGGITRFMGVFLCDPTPQVTGPVRSARTYFLDWLSEYNAFYAHVGGANSNGMATESKADALAQIKRYGIKDFDYSPGFYRDENRNPDVAYEHTAYLDMDRLRKYAKDTWKWGAEVNGTRWDTTFEKWKFIDDNTQTTAEASAAATISYQFWDTSASLFNVTWNYDAASKTYARTMAGKSHVDKNNNEQIKVSDMIIMFQEESKANDEYQGNLHLLYKTIGTGQAYIFMNGNMIKGTWSKSGRTAKTKFLDSFGHEIPLARGKIWISIVPTFSKATVKVQ
ncbi:MAG: DUF3048 domain-containing protein [bacterium]|nr:DUF3048 domain-containing protein [bacterium]